MPCLSLTHQDFDNLVGPELLNTIQTDYDMVSVWSPRYDLTSVYEHIVAASKHIETTMLTDHTIKLKIKAR